MLQKQDSDIVLVEGNNELNVQLVPVVEPWVNPTAHTIGSEDWMYPERAYDDDVVSKAYYNIIFSGYTTLLTLFLPSAITSSKLKCYLDAAKQGLTTTEVKIEIYDGTTWLSLGQFVPSWEQWFEVSYAQQAVTRVRFSFYQPDAYRTYPSVCEVKVSKYF